MLNNINPPYICGEYECRKDCEVCKQLGKNKNRGVN
jgi:hypothetical protein